MEKVILRFKFEALPGRVIFGAGSLARLPEEIARLGATRAMVLSTPEQCEQAADIARRLGKLAAGIFNRAVMHVPIETAQEACNEAKRIGADCCVTVGGGSTTGLGKAIALVSDLPIVAVPTTYAGSEMTPIWGLTQDGIKKTGRDIRVLPKTVMYDPELTLSMPKSLSGTSGINAIAHCVEALYAEDANPIISLMAEEGIRVLARSLPVVVKEPRNLESRSHALYGAWLAGASLGAVGMALHHKLCHTLGGAFNLPHAQTHTAVLPHAVAYNAEAAGDAIERVARALGAPKASTGLFDLGVSVGAKMALREIGSRAADLDRVADLAIENPYYNPRPITRAAIRSLLDDAFEGRRPRT
ncbi:MAG: maleylacetate reductase [Candidatus Binataceae bacterium]